MQEHTGRNPSIEELRTAYERAGGNVSEVARQLGRSRMVVHERLVDAGIHEPTERPSDRLEKLDADDIPALAGGDR